MTRKSSRNKPAVTTEKQKLEKIKDAKVIVDQLNVSPATSSDIRSDGPSEGGCFVCGNAKVSSLSQGRRHYERQVVLFKGLLEEEECDRKHSCTECLSDIKEVWDLQQQIDAIREDINVILKRARIRRSDADKSSPLKKGTTRPQVAKRSKGRPISTPKLSTSPNKKTSPKSPTLTKAPVTSESPIKIENISSEADFDICSTITLSPSFIKEESDDDEGVVPSEIIPHGIDQGRPVADRPKRKSRILAEEFLRTTISGDVRPKKMKKFEANEESGESEYSNSDAESDSDSSYNSHSSDTASKTETDCIQCGKSFRTKKNLRMHTKRAHLPGRYKCQHCEKTVASNYELVAHVKYNHTHDVFPCSVCGKGLSSKKRCIVHEIIVCEVEQDPERLKEFNITLLKCPEPGCEKVFDRKSGLIKHTRKHTGDKPFCCVKCGKTFTDKHYLSIHEKAICGTNKEIQERMHARLQKYKNLRTTDTTYSHACSFCPRVRYKKASQLEKHQQKYHPNGTKHVPKITMVCQICGVIVKADHLSRHIRLVHEGFRPHTCTHPGCGKTFTRLTSRKLHEQTLHAKIPLPPRPKVTCDECGRMFSHPSTLSHHKNLVHKGIPHKFECNQCPRKFFKRFTFNRHKALHEKHGHTCGVCGTNFYSAEKLEKHKGGKKCSLKDRSQVRIMSKSNDNTIKTEMNEDSSNPNIEVITEVIIESISQQEVII